MFSRVPSVGVDHTLATVVAHVEAPKIAPPISVPVSESISTMPVQSGPEISLAVGDYVAFTTTFANCVSSSTIPVVHYYPPCTTP